MSLPGPAGEVPRGVSLKAVRWECNFTYVPLFLALANTFVNIEPFKTLSHQPGFNLADLLNGRYPPQRVGFFMDPSVARLRISHLRLEGVPFVQFLSRVAEAANVRTFKRDGRWFAVQTPGAHLVTRNGVYYFLRAGETRLTVRTAHSRYSRGGPPKQAGQHEGDGAHPRVAGPPRWANARIVRRGPAIYVVPGSGPPIMIDRTQERRSKERKPSTITKGKNK